MRTAPLSRNFVGLWLDLDLWGPEYAGLSWPQLILLREIAALDTPERGCYAGNQHLASIARCDERQLQRYLADLVAKGFVSSKITTDPGVIGGRVRTLRLLPLPRRAPEGREGDDIATVTPPVEPPPRRDRHGDPTVTETVDSTTTVTVESTVTLPVDLTCDLATDQARESPCQVPLSYQQQQQQRARNGCALPRAAGPGEPATHAAHAIGCALPRAAADLDTQIETTGRPADALHGPVPPPQAALPSQAIEVYDAGRELLRRQGIAAAKAAALAQGRDVEELREWIRIARDKKHPTGFLVAMLSANEPLPAEAEQRLLARDRAQSHQRRAQQREQAQAAEPVPDLCDLFPEYRRRVLRWRDYTPNSASSVAAAPTSAPELAAMQSHSAARGGVYTRELCPNVNR